MNEKPSWLKRIFPWEQKTLNVNGHSMAYVDEGSADAPPVLLLHGNPTWGFLYRDFVGPLVSAGYRVIVPDWIGAVTQIIRVSMRASRSLIILPTWCR